MRKTNASRRSGFTLIELSVVMLSLTAFLLVATSLLVFMLHQGTDMKRREFVERDWSRLSQTFREDVEASSDFTAVVPESDGTESDAPTAWRFTSKDDETIIEYRFLAGKNRVERIVLAKEEDAAALGQEWYSVPELCQIAIDIDVVTPEIVSLHLNPPVEQPTGSRRVDAILNKR
jgi:hypothetical protein